MKKIIRKGLYVHIPFCKNICAYCSFSKLFYLQKFIDAYLLALKKELEKYDNYIFNSIYIGGGTPTSLSSQELQKLFEILLPYKDKDTIITIETNPDISDEKIKVLSLYSVRRVSIGVQTFNEDYLKLMNRQGYFSNIKSLIFKLRKNGIRDINCDLMYGLPNQTINQLQDDLEKFLELDINHVSTYCLQVEQGSLFYHQGIKEMDGDLVREQYDFIVKKLKQSGFNRYEVSNFSKKGFESKHNLIYWHNEEYGGVGLSASSYINGVRKTNTKSFTNYIKGNYNDYQEILSIDDKKFYHLMLGLRLEEGISISKFNNQYNCSLIDEYKSKIDKLLKDGSLIVDDDYLKINPDMMFILDTILKKLLF